MAQTLSGEYRNDGKSTGSYYTRINWSVSYKFEERNGNFYIKFYSPKISVPSYALYHDEFKKEYSLAELGLGSWPHARQLPFAMTVKANVSDGYNNYEVSASCNADFTCGDNYIVSKAKVKNVTLQNFKVTNTTYFRANLGGEPAVDEMLKVKRKPVDKIAQDKTAIKTSVNRAGNDTKTEKEIKATEKTGLGKTKLASTEEKKGEDKVGRGNEIKKNREIPASAGPKSSVKGPIAKVDLSAVTTFENNTERVYGIMADGKEILRLPFEESRTSIKRIKGTDLFEVMVMGKHPNGWEKYLHSFVIDYKGKKFSVNGTNKFDFPVEVNADSKKLYLYKKLAEPERLGNKCPEAKTFGVVFPSKEAAVADISKGTGGTCITLSMVSANVSVYTADYNLKLLDQVNGYVIFGFSWSGLFRD